MRARTIDDLIRELETEPGRAALVVVGSHMPVLVWSDDPDRIRALESAIDQGGAPVGIVRAEGGQVVGSRAFCEYADDEPVAELLRSLGT